MKLIVTFFISAIVMTSSVFGQNRCCPWFHAPPGQCEEISISAKALMKQRLSCVSPIIPQNIRYRSAVPVTISVNPIGDVICAQIYRGVRDDVRKATLEAVRKWKFKPFKIDGRTVAVTSLIAVAITGNPDITCRNREEK